VHESTMSPISLPAYAGEQLAELPVTQLIELLVRDEDRVPRNVIDECARRGGSMLDALKAMFSGEAAWRHDVPLGAWWLRLHAAMIFGLMPTEAAALALVEWMRRLTRNGVDDLQEWLAGRWPVLLRNKPDTVQRDLRALCDDRALDWYTRAVAIDPIVFIGARRGREDLEAELAWVALLAAGEDEDWDFRFCAGLTLLQFPRARYRSIVEALALAGECGRTMSIDMVDVEDAYARCRDEPEWVRWQDPWTFYTPANIAARRERWLERPPQGGAETKPGDAANDLDLGTRGRQDKRRPQRLH